MGKKKFSFLPEEVVSSCQKTWFNQNSNCPCTLEIDWAKFQLSQHFMMDFKTFQAHRFHQDLSSISSFINRNAIFITRQSARASNECSKNLFLTFVICHFKIYSFVIIPLLSTSLFVINNSLVIKVYFQYKSYFHIQIFMFLCSIFLQ